MINISNIKIINFKSIKKMNISLLVNSAGLDRDILLGGFKYVLNNKNGLAAYNVFFGRNSIGKSSILEAISLVMDLHNDSISTYILNMMINEEAQLSPRTINNILDLHNEKNRLAPEIQNGINSGQGEYFHKFQTRLSNIIKNKYNKLASDKNKPIEISFEFIVDEQTYELSLSIEDDLIKSELRNLQNFNDKPSNKIIKEIQKYLRDSLPSSGGYTLNENLMTFETNYMRPSAQDKALIEIALIFLKKTLGLPKLLNLIKLADPLIDDIVFTKSNDNEILNKIIVDATNVDVMSLSTGTRQFILMLWTIISKASVGNCLVMIDEIELSLHKELIDVLKIIMNELFVKKNIQFIFTTHSPLAVYDYTSFKQIYSISIDENRNHIIERLSSKFKNHQNIINRYIEGDLALYPDTELARNIAGGLFD